MTNEVVDNAHVDMERRLERGRRHDIGKHDFFDRVEDFAERSNAVLEAPTHIEDAQTFDEPDMLVRQKPSKVMTVNQAAVGSNPSAISPPIDGQVELFIQNIGANDVFIGPSSSTAQSWQGYRIAAGSEKEIKFTGGVWASSPNGSTVCVMALAYGSRG